MAFASFLLVVILLPHIEALSHGPSSNEPDQTMQAMMTQACINVDNQKSCLSNMQTEVEKTGRPPNPSSILTAALRTTLNEARLAIQSITKFNSLSFSYREQIATEDCKELLDFSVSELAWSLSEMKNIRAGLKSVHYEGNLKAWLSAALSNQDTCLEGFEGTDRHVERFISGSLREVTQLIGNVLALYTQLHSLPFKPPRNSTATTTTKKSSNFPKWMTEGDQELLKSHPRGMHVDATVALDGSGDYRTITEAIAAAPSYSVRRYIIYVKKGIYRENIDMKKKKTNIMVVGDGMGQTIVTGNRHFMQGWTTFRTATVG
jgi:pectinesterase